MHFGHEGTHTIDQLKINNSILNTYKYKMGTNFGQESVYHTKSTMHEGPISPAIYNKRN